MIPSLVKTLKKQNQHPLVGVASLLLSFTAAFEHVPVHRRFPLFSLLLQTLGEDDFLFAFLSILADKYAGNRDAEAFALQLTAQYTPLTQLMVSSEISNVLCAVTDHMQSVSKTLDLLTDLLGPARTLSRVLLSTSDEEGLTSVDTARSILLLMEKILSSQLLASRMSQSSDLGNMDSQIQNILSSLLEKLLGFVEMVKDRERG